MSAPIGTRAPVRMMPRRSESKWAVSPVAPHDQDEDEYDNEQHSADDPPHPSHGIAAIAT